MEKRRSTAVGIDLGTTYTCVGAWRNDRVEIITNDQGNRTTPSYVAFKDDDRLVGEGAKNQAASNPTNTIFDVKRLIGRRFTDTTVQSDMALWPFKVIEGKEGRPMVVVEHQGKERHFAAEEISAMILSEMKKIAESFFGHSIHNAVVTVPAYFSNAQRQSTKDAGMIAGLNILRIINEPTAAALAYGFNMKANGDKLNKKVLIFDLGGGTFDVSLLEVENGVVEVKATAGDTHLGGEDFDNRMVLYLAEDFKRKHGKDVTKSARAMRRLRTTCERAKRNLSFTTFAEIEIDCLHDGIDFHAKFSRAKFEELNMDLFDKCIEVLDRCLKDAKMEKSRVDDIVLVGGSTRIPKVQQMLKEYFGGKLLCNSLNVDEAVAYGAAIEAASLGGEPSQLVPHVVLVDVTPLSLGLANYLDVMEVVIPRNTPIPVQREFYWTTTYDYASDMDIHIYEGERSMAIDNNFLGEFTLYGITPRPAGAANLRVVFHLDADCILRVTAKDVDTGKEATKIIVRNEQNHLTKVEIERMVLDAKRYRFEDDQRKRKEEARCDLEMFAHAHRNTMRSSSVASKLTSREKSMLESAFAKAIEWSNVNASNADEYDFKDEKHKLEKLWNTVKEKFCL